MARQGRPYVLVLSTITLRASIDTLLSDLAAALQRRGVFCRVFIDSPGMSNLPLVASLLGDLRDHPGPRFVIDINAKSHFAVAQGDGREVSIHDLWQLPRLSIFESNPVLHLEHLQRLPANAAVTTVDQAHLEVFEAFGCHPRAAGFLPHGGPAPLERVLPLAERPFDVLFLGNVEAEPARAGWQGLADTPALARVLATCQERSRVEPLPAIDLLRDQLAQDGLAAEPQRDLRLAMLLENWLCLATRRELLAALARSRLTVCVCGALDLPLPPRPGLTVLGPTTFACALDLMEQSRIVLNTMKSRTGAHERVFYGLSRGALIVSDPSTLLAPAVAAGAGIVTLPADPAALEPELQARLADPALAGQIAAGRAWSAREHSWDQRAGRVLELMAPLWG